MRERAVSGGGLVSIRTDITERKRTESQLRKAHAELETRIEERTSELTDEIAEHKQTEAALKESGERVRAILDNVPVSFFLKDADGRYKFINSRYADWFGIDPDAVDGRTVHDMFPADRADRYRAVDRRIRETLSTVTEEVEIPLPSGDTRTFAMTKFPILNDRELTDIGGVMIDITERRAAENAVREKAGVLEATMKTIPDGLQVLDRDLDLVAWNEELFTVFDLDKKEILEADDPGKALRYALADNGAYGPGDREELVASREDITRLREGVQFERELENGKWIECCGLPIEEDGGWVAVFRDVSERRKLERRKNEFVTTVSHELRTPLTSIYGSLGLVQNDAIGGLPENAQHLVEIAHKNCARLVDLVNDILDVGKIEAGKLEYSMAPVSIRELVDDALEANEAYGVQFGVTFEISGDIPDLTITADYRKLLQVMTNLLSNASKHSPDGGRVAISVKRNASIATFAVRDWGNGIPEEYHDVIFDKFSKIDYADSQTVHGTGLGLSICKSIIDRHDGEIRFVSKPGEGSTFFFELPVD